MLKLGFPYNEPKLDHTAGKKQGEIIWAEDFFSETKKKQRRKYEVKVKIITNCRRKQTLKAT